MPSYVGALERTGLNGISLPWNALDPLPSTPPRDAAHSVQDECNTIEPDPSSSRGAI